jgi:DNA topoisomerase-1
VQTVAVRLIVEREREIRKFEKKEYWTIDAELAARKPPLLTARLVKLNDAAIEIGDQAGADRVVAQVEGQPFTVRCSRSLPASCGSA